MYEAEQKYEKEKNTQWHFESSTVKNKYFITEVVPTEDSDPYGYRSLVLNLRNTSNCDLEVDWNRTSFIHDDQTEGRFMPADEPTRYIDMPRNPDIVLQGTLFKKALYPNSLTSILDRSYQHENLPTGNIGIYLVVKCGNNEIRERLITNVTAIYPSN